MPHNWIEKSVPGRCAIGCLEHNAKGVFYDAFLFWNVTNQFNIGAALKKIVLILAPYYHRCD